MKVKLDIVEGGEVKEKSFSSMRMRGRAFMRMLQVQDILAEAEKAETFTEAHYLLMCEFICEMFENKFTVDDLLDGIDLEEVYPLFNKLGEEVGNKAMKKVSNLVKK